MDKSNGFSLGGADCTRGPVALGPFGVVRASAERRMQGDGTEGGGWAGGGARYVLVVIEY